MTLPQSAFRMSNRRSLANQAMLASIKARTSARLDLQSPICIYALCEENGVTVRFNGISMEGMYDKGPKPRIHLSALRPLVRRNFNCAHELGHHLFGHGSTIDELRDEATASAHEHPNEILANTSASFVLMPTLGIRQAFATRGLSPQSATPEQMYAVACNFGVGYSTLINHLAYAVSTIPRQRAKALLQATPKTIRTGILEEITSEPLVLVDEHWNSATLDAEVGMHILLPGNAQIAGDVVEYQRDLPGGNLYRAVKPGIGRGACPETSWATFIRVSRYQYVGLARYRHLEDSTDE